jgi:AcrR family transcriptional regulator
MKQVKKRSRRRLAPDARRAELIAAAIRVLKQHGNAASRVEDVTAAANAAKGTFYIYFPSWDDLLAAVRDHILNDYATGLRRRMADPKCVDWWAVLDQECTNFIDFFIELGPLHEAVFHGPIAERPIDDERSATRLISELLRAGIEARAFASVDIEPSARLIFSVLHEAADAIAQGGDRNRFIQSLKQLLHHWLSPWPAR